MTQKVLITGITGQIGSYLAERYDCFEHIDINKRGRPYQTFGLVRGSSVNNKERLKDSFCYRNLTFLQGDLTDFASLSKILKELQPNIIVNLAAQSSVFTSYQEPIYTWDVTARGFLNLLESVRIFSPESKLFQASSSEVFGDNSFKYYNDNLMISHYQTEQTAIKPLNPYAVAKAAAHQLAQIYREKYGLKIYLGIIYPNDSPRRHESFFTRKVTKYVGKLHKQGGTLKLLWDTKLKLGNLNSFRDFGHSSDVANAIQLILEGDTPQDYIIATGINYKVEDFVCEAFKQVDLNYKDYIEIDQDLYRKESDKNIQADNTKLVQYLGWEPKYDFHSLVKEMVQHDINV